MTTFPNQAPKPASVSLNFQSSSYLPSENGFSTKISVVKQLDGTPFDMSAAATASVILDNGQPTGSSGYFSTLLGATLSNQAVGSFELDSTPTQIAALISAMKPYGASRGNVTITLTDGTYTLVVGQGQWSLSASA